MLLRLPHELLENILLQLDPLSVKACALWSREFITIIRSSIALRYLLACHAAGVVDNPHCKLSYAECYEALRKREKGWCRLQPAFIQTFDVWHGFTLKYDLTSGVYLQVAYRDVGVHYCTLPSTPNNVPRWAAINAFGPSSNGDEELQIVDVGMAIHEHDLVVVISRNDHRTFTLEIILLQFSTGEYHPMAQSSRIFVQEPLWLVPRYTIHLRLENRRQKTES
ncbi:hypothetical protein AX14_004682 [Amanita brunnescens Koide BX004]|nr:hypothetical protein AX14_004682 [Amanita brunnescens Koide BX004]